MIGVGLALDGVALLERLAMKVLIAASAPKRLHVLHPEVVRECADAMYRLFEAVLDLEAQPIQASDLVGIPMPVPLSILRSKTAEAKNFQAPERVRSPTRKGIDPTAFGVAPERRRRSATGDDTAPVSHVYLAGLGSTKASNSSPEPNVND